MALFLGRLTPDTRSRDLEDLFAKYGRVTRLDIKRGTNSGFGFVEYEDPRDAEEAVHKLNRHVVNGSEIVVEFAKNNGRRAGDNECFKCGREGHWARDCRESGRRDGRDRRRSRSPRRFRSRSRSPRRYRSRSRSPRRDRRDDRDYGRDSRDDRRGYGREERRGDDSERRDYDRRGSRQEDSRREQSPARGRSPSPAADRGDDREDRERRSSNAEPRHRSISPAPQDRARSLTPDGR
ncbi:hypothetical protein BGZ82_000483 [Podila clonocystis]|nr:hypothetical protein BGZ82_000483 [Podila clonocystis]